MTVTTELARKSFPWTGVETALSCGFPAEDASHLRVFFTTTAGITSQLTVGINYSVSLASGSGLATVLPILMPAASGTIAVERRTPALVFEVLADGQDFSLEVIQRMHDRAMMVAAEYRTLLSRAIVLAEGAEVGSGAFDLQETRLGNLAPGILPNDAATVSQLQGIGGASGNVPPPVTGQVGQLLTALGANLFGWSGVPAPPDGSVSLVKLADGALAASTAGRAKMADGFLVAAKMADGALSADDAGRGKMADGFFAAAAGSRAKFADKFLPLAKIVDIASAVILGRRTADNGPIEPLSAEDVRALIASEFFATLMTSTDANALRSSLAAAPVPTVSASLGQFTHLFGSVANIVLPAGGTWLWWLQPFGAGTGNLNGTPTAGIHAGGTTVQAATGGVGHTGFCWRIA